MVADIPLAAQTSLLRFLDSMEVCAVGAHKAEKADVQIVSATNRNLEEMVTQRLFRADLYYRLNAFAIHLPVLRARTDFAAIVRQVMEEMAPGTPITDAAVAALYRRKWPGNIRELKTVLQRALFRCRADYLDEDCFDEASPVAESLQGCCEGCGNRPLSRAKCQEIRAVHRRTGGNVSQTRANSASPARQSTSTSCDESTGLVSDSGRRVAGSRSCRRRDRR